jgi:uncharacterized protein YndB with AHSA1/START domain
MPSIERTVTVDTPVERVFAFMADFTTTERWDPPTVSTTRTSGDGGVGTTYHTVTKMLGTTNEVDYTVLQRDENVLLQLEGDAGPMRLLDTIRFESTPSGGTSVHYRAEFHPTGLAKLATPLLPPGLKILGDKVASSLEDELQRLGSA